MRGLLIKDYKLIKQQKYLLFLLVIGIAVCAFVGNAESLLVFSTLVGFLLAMTTINYDEFDNGNAFLFSLPISRKSYVKEKYAFGLLCGGIGLILSTVVCLLIQLLKNQGVDSSLWATVGTSIITLVMIASIAFPFQLKYGGEKGRIVLLVVIFITVALVRLLVNIFSLFPITFSHHHMMMDHTIMFPILFLIVTAVVFWLSYRISVSIMNHKEF
ncbi:MAG: ABC-2 transporter permease [Erysipelotrichaceae bacterium]|nr:ABC-2 transporter permease [Erysipelotrichaceae bacterium]